MPTGLLFLNDVAVTLINGKEVIASVPGVITRKDSGLVIGAEALALARHYPTDTNADFWHKLGLEKATSHGHTYADLAYAHLQHVWETARGQLDSLVLLVPTSMTREQLGLLLGMTQKLEIPVRGLLDASIFCGAKPAPGRKLIYLQLQRHQLLSVELEQGKVLSVERSDGEPRLGLARLYEAWAEAAADAFVRKTRFDPMHSADTEQQIYDHLGEWVGELGNSLTVPLTLDRDGEPVSTELRRDALLASTSDHYQRLIDGLEEKREGAALTLVIDERMAALPGLADLLGALPDVELQVVSADHARVTVVDTRQSWVTAKTEKLRLVRQIPWTANPTAMLTPANSAMISGEPPTHVLHEGRAWPLGEDKMIIGLDGGSAKPGPQLSRRYPGVSRQHFCLRDKHGDIWVEDLSRYGTFVNGARVAGTQLLRTGDDIRVGNPGAHFQLIRVESDGS